MVPQSLVEEAVYHIGKVVEGNKAAVPVAEGSSQAVGHIVVEAGSTAVADHSLGRSYTAAAREFDLDTSEKKVLGREEKVWKEDWTHSIVSYFVEDFHQSRWRYE